MAKERTNAKLPKQPPERKDPLEGELGERGEPMSPLTAWYGANPGAENATSFSDPYLINCQRNPYVYALRRAGYDVEALPNEDGFGGNRLVYNPSIHSYEFDNSYMWRGVVNPEAHVTMQGATYKEELANIRKQMAEWGDGSIAAVSVFWKGGNGHVFVAEQINGETVFLDTQVSRRNDVPDVFRDESVQSRKRLSIGDGKVSYAGSDVNIEKRMANTVRAIHGVRATTLTRLDNAQYNPEMLKRVCTKKRKET